ncbi:unnamed protein product [Urochloa humidicola]
MAGDGSGVDWESLAEATSGAIGSLVSTTVLYPLDTCKTKFQAELQTHHGAHKYRNLSDVFWEAIRKRQLLSLYQGLNTKNFQSFISSFFYFYGYSYFKRLGEEWSKDYWNNSQLDSCSCCWCLHSYRDTATRYSGF